MKRALTLAATLLAATVATTAPTDAAITDSPRYVSFVVGRGLYAEGVACKPADGSVNTLRVAKYADALGIPMAANLIVQRVEAASDGGHHCEAGGTHLYLNLGDAKNLRDRYGWQHSTSGMTYAIMTDLTTDRQREAEACGALRWMRANGFTRADAMYAAPQPGDRPAVDAADVRVIRGCGYTLVRDYGQNTWPYHLLKPDGTRNPANLRGRLHPDHLYRTLSVNGGSCPDSWDCWSGSLREYTDPAVVLSDLRAAPGDSHTIIQWYRLVEGDRPGWWKCSGPASTHRTYHAETYCWGDLKRILDGLPGDYRATDVETVVRKWGLS